ncbi:MAG: flagellar motor protein MotB [SAR324 cluster bacterium]|nr:flagellar motor protein MotB [SAR324 cluster bacterium]
MGQMIDEEDCEVCVEFTQGWIFTYGDLVTLLLCFFILLFSMCKLDVEKIKEVSQSFQTKPPGSPFVFSGKQSVMEQVAREFEELDMPDDVTVNVDGEGIEISFKETVLFGIGSAELSQEAKDALLKAVSILSGVQNTVLVEGHTDSESDDNSDYASNWEFSAARASAVATFLEESGIDGKRLQVSGYAGLRPRFYNDTSYKRSLNRRVDILLLPEDLTR